MVIVHRRNRETPDRELREDGRDQRTREKKRETEREKGTHRCCSLQLPLRLNGSGIDLPLVRYREDS
jgi:hypothetical protein